MELDRADVVVVGCGIVGATAAVRLCQAGLKVVILERGMTFGVRFAGHVQNHMLVASSPGLTNYLADVLVTPVAVANGMKARSEDERLSFRPRLGWAAGGMSIVWSGVAQRFDPSEQWDGFAGARSETLYAAAEHMLAARAAMRASTLREVQDRLPSELAQRAVATVMALRDGRVIGPADILDQAPGVGAHIRANHCACRLVARGGRVTSIVALDLATKRRCEIAADFFLLALGPLATPQLIAASGLDGGNESALGRFMTEHLMCVARIARTTGDMQVVEGDSFALPYRPGAAGNGLSFARTAQDASAWNLHWYAPSFPVRSNRVRFSAEHADDVGLPLPEFQFDAAACWPNGADALLREMSEIGEKLGGLRFGHAPRRAHTNAACHLYGTTRMGPDDRDHVVNMFGRHHGFDNLYIAGTSVIPGASATNPTLTAVALAMGSCEQIMH